MSVTTDFLVNIRRITKLHENMLKEHICREYGLTLMEATVISFLHNNPGRDTAADIAELRMLPKGNISQAVETLFQKGLLRREQDSRDRRKIHLSLTDKADPVVRSADALRQRFHRQIFAGLSAEELELLYKINQQIDKNTRRIAEQKGVERNE